MGHDHKIRFVFKCLIYRFHIGIHPGADPFTGGKKIFYHAYFSQHILIGKNKSVLVGEMKRLHIADYRQFCFPHIRSPEKKKIKPGYKHGKKDKVPDQFLIHAAKLRFNYVAAGGTGNYHKYFATLLHCCIFAGYES
jgi:hypothetical protein